MNATHTQREKEPCVERERGEGETIEASSTIDNYSACGASKVYGCIAIVLEQLQRVLFMLQAAI